MVDQWRTEVRQLVKLLDQDGPFDPNTELARNKLHISPTIDGLLQLNATFTEDVAGGTAILIEQRANDLYRQFVRDHETDPGIAIPPRATLRALAAVELMRAGAAVDVNATVPPRPEVGWVILAGEPVVYGPPSPEDPPSDDHADDDAGVDARSKPVAQVTGAPSEPAEETAARLRTTLFERPGVVDQRGVSMQDGTTRTLMCDPDIHAIVVDSLGAVIDQGRRTRLATPGQRRALAALYGGCAMDGCDKPIYWTEVHHSEPFFAGGRTDLRLLVPFCRGHHGVCHRHGWKVCIAEDGWAYIVTAERRTFWTQRHRHRRTDQPPPAPT